MTTTGLSKTQRQYRIATLLADRPINSQAQLVEVLGAEGIVATQATVSRDLEELGAVKARTAQGETAYVIPEQPQDQVAPAELLQRVCSDWVVEVDSSKNLVVVRTPPGSAHLVGAAIDRAGWDSVVGTVAGDDTILVVVGEPFSGADVAGEFRDLAGL